MESKVAQQAEQSAIEAVRKLTPEERLYAFMAHCELMMALHQAGQQSR